MWLFVRHHEVLFIICFVVAQCLDHLVAAHCREQQRGIAKWIRRKLGICRVHIRACIEYSYFLRVFYRFDSHVTAINFHLRPFLHFLHRLRRHSPVGAVSHARVRVYE